MQVLRSVLRKEAKQRSREFLAQTQEKQKIARDSAWERDYRQNIAPNLARIRAAGGA